MSMTASELFEVVKDVPREAWPEHVWYFPPITCNDAEVMNSGGAWREKPYGQFINDATAHNAFVGSMTVWLAFHNWFPKSHIWRDGARVMLVDGTTHKAPSLVAALAAACKEAA